MTAAVAAKMFHGEGFLVITLHTDYTNYATNVRGYLLAYNLKMQDALISTMESQYNFT